MVALTRVLKIMQIFQFELGQLGTNSYLVFPDGSDSAFVVDAPYEAAEVIPEFLKSRGKSLEAILLTHPHWDHIWDTAPLAKKTGAKVYASSEAKVFIEDPQMQTEKLFAPGQFEPARVDVCLSDNQVLDICGARVECFDVPGHCPGSSAFFVSDARDKKVFVGDLLFNGSVGRTDFYGGNFAQLAKSIKTKIYTLPDDVEVLTGHGISTSVGAEKRSNPYVSQD